MIGSTAAPEEIAKFEGLANSWWDRQGVFRPLHAINPTRLAFIRRLCLTHFNRDDAATTPFAGLSLVDIGCGGGLLCEPMTRLGFRTTGIDASAKNAAAARLHAEQEGLNVEYRVGLAETLTAEGRQYDVVLAMEVVEHVANVNLFLDCCAQLLKPGGILLASTINRTAASLLKAKIGAEYVLRWLPRGTHDWRKFITPSEFACGLRRVGLVAFEIKGMTYGIFNNSWSPSEDLSANYLLAAAPLVRAPRNDG